RATTLASGRTGVRPVGVETFVAMLNAGITPAVRVFGSLGCSGDLAPLSHVALALMGEGVVVGTDGALRPAGEALAGAGTGP
ncbi:aromatic amino acid lyase, partial [Micrococcus sp. GbtcB5]|uniref:aromatic amino acid lyase n=1 Tax=Micrococcus sp. GbtcB5 TaxID=2824750 RepID=UPI001C2F2631